MSQVYICTTAQAFAQQTYLFTPLVGLAGLGVARVIGKRLDRSAWLLALTLPPSLMAPLSRAFYFGGLDLPTLGRLNFGSMLLLGSSDVCFYGFPLIAAWALCRSFRQPTRRANVWTFVALALLCVPLLLTASLLNDETCSSATEINMRN
jgi:hypothetical protein